MPVLLCYKALKAANKSPICRDTS